MRKKVRKLESACARVSKDEDERQSVHFGETNPSVAATNLRLYETIAGRVPLFRDCY
jgi:hypothetical protein